MPEIEALDAALMYRLVVRIRKNVRTELLRAEWNQALPFMAMGFIKSMSFEEYMNRNERTVDMRPTEEILAEVEEIRKQMKEG